MGFFSYMYTREGSGVPENAPRKKGIARFWEILTQDYSKLWKASMLLMVCCIPLMLTVVCTVIILQTPPYPLLLLLLMAVVYVLAALPVGPALAAMHVIVVKAVLDIPGFFWHSYKKAWKENWRQSMPLGIVGCALCALEVMSVFLYLSTKQASPVLLGLGMLGILVVLTCWLFATLQLLFLNLTVGVALKNSLLLTFGYVKRSLPAGLSILLLGGGIILWVPIPFWILPVLLGVPALIAVVADMWVWPVMEQVFHVSELQAEKCARKEQDNVAI